MTRGDSTGSNKNFLRAKLENFGKGPDTPYFKITKWNGMEAEEIGKGAFIEGTLQKITAKETQYGTYVLFDIYDAENNAIQWGMKLGQTMRNILFKLYVPASKDIKINNIMLKTGVFNEKKFVSIFVDGQKYDNPFSKWNDMLQKYEVSPEITEKVRVVKDPETGEIVKKDETKLDEWVQSLIIPTINSCLRKEGEAFWSIGTEVKVDGTPVNGTMTNANEVPIADTIKEVNGINNDLDLDDLPF